MRVAIAVTRESVLSVVAYAYEVIDFCVRMQRVGMERNQLFAVSSEPGDDFTRRFGFFEFVDSRLTMPVDWIFVPALQIDRPWTAAQHKPLLQWLRRSAERGALITSVGTGSFLLAEAGLLNGKEAVTYSHYGDYFAERYPQVQLHRNIDYLRTDNLILSADLPWQELLLSTISKYWGVETAQTVANTYALHWDHTIGPGCSKMLVLDPVIANAQRWFSEHLNEHNLLNRCSQYVSLTRRTFSRRFKEATGMTPLDFVHHARLQASQNLLMFTDRSIEDICYDVGYDAAAFYKFFRQHAGISPSKFRKQFAPGSA